MFYADHERQIYTPAGSDKKYDPLALTRNLIIASDNQIDELLKLWQDKDADTGDFSPEGKKKRILESARAEEYLVQIARKAFGLAQFPEVTDAVAIETLVDFCEYMKKKESTGGNTSPSRESSG